MEAELRVPSLSVCCGVLLVTLWLELGGPVGQDPRHQVRRRPDRRLASSKSLGCFLSNFSSLFLFFSFSPSRGIPSPSYLTSCDEQGFSTPSSSTSSSWVPRMCSSRSGSSRVASWVWMDSSRVFFSWVLMSSSRSGSSRSGSSRSGSSRIGSSRSGSSRVGSRVWMDSSRRFHWEKLFFTDGELSVGGRRRGLATWWTSRLHWQSW